MRTWLRLALQQIRNHRRFSYFFCLNLALGLSGFVILDAFKTTLKGELYEGSRNILAADIEVEARNRKFTDEEAKTLLSLLPDQSQIAHSYSLFSMAAVESRSRLIRLVGVTDLYPLYGKLTLREQGGILRETPKAIVQQPKIWISPELAIQLNVDIGSTVKIGEMHFTVDDIVEQDTAGSATAFNFAPKVFVSDALIPQLGLLAAGSRFQESYFIALAQPNQFEDVAQLLTATFKATRDIRVTTHINASENLARSLTYLTDYLGLVALVALFLSALGSAYLFRSFILSKRQEIATLMSLGATSWQARNIYVLQLVLLGGAAAIVALMIAVMGFPLVPILSKGLLPFVLYPTLNLRVVSLAMVMGTVGSVLICLPLLARIGRLSPALLFNEFALNEPLRLRSAWMYLPVVVLYWMMAVWEAQSVFVGTVFMGGFITAALVFGLISWGLFTCLGHSALRTLSIRLALRNLYRNRLTTASCFLAISLGSLLICMVPQIHHLVLEEVSSPAGFELPSLFLIDIQDEQMAGVETTLEEQNTKLQFASPLVRARLMSVNGDDVQVRDDEGAPVTREQERQRWVRTRGQNITVRAEPYPSEKLIAGRLFSGVYDWESDKPAEISLEMRFAERLRVGIGDRLMFDVQGVDIETEVVSIRRVKWTSFQPNFFIVMQPGVLDDAPTVHIASVPLLTDERKYALQSLLVEKYPNISIVDVGSTIQRVLVILGKMGWIIKAMAFFALVAGFVVLFSIANHQAQARRWDINLFKVLGADFPLVRRTVFWEFGVLGTSAAVSGSAGSFIVSYVFATVVFDSPWEFNWQIPLLATAAIAVVSILTALSASQRVLREKPLGILNEA